MRKQRVNHAWIMAMFTLVLMGAARPASAEQEHEHEHAMPAPPEALAPFRALEGTWQGAMAHGEGQSQLTVTYKVTSGGSAVVETMDVGTPHEMVTVIHADGDKLALTHYCALGNQPRMIAQPTAASGGEGGTYTFVCQGGANIPDESAMHMHQVVYRLIDDRTLEADWTLYVDGKPADVARLTLRRAESGAE